VLLYENGRMRPVQTTPGIKENDGGDELNYDVF
jgi:hypothetical protein